MPLLVLNSKKKPSIFSTGGDEIFELNGYKVHVFNSSGVFSINKDTTIEYLIIGGGARGGRYTGAGGGGAGGALDSSREIQAGNYTVVVGGAGSMSKFLGQSAFAGGQGGSNGYSGSSGGSGGGGCCIPLYDIGPGCSVSAGGSAIQGTAGQDGKCSTVNSIYVFYGGRGGGAAKYYGDRFGDNIGQNGTLAGGGSGLNLYRYSATSTKTSLDYIYSGGGGGKLSPSGKINTGGGGAASDTSSYNYGGSGIVIIRYAI